MLLLFAFLAAANHSATLSWQWSANALPAKQFSIQRGPSTAGPFHQVATAPLTARSYTDRSISKRTAPWCYQIIVIGKKKNSLINPVVCGVLQ